MVFEAPVFEHIGKLSLLKGFVKFLYRPKARLEDVRLEVNGRELRALMTITIERPGLRKRLRRPEIQTTILPVPIHAYAIEAELDAKQLEEEFMLQDVLERSAAQIVNLWSTKIPGIGKRLKVTCSSRIPLDPSVLVRITSSQVVSNERVYTFENLFSLPIRNFAVTIPVTRPIRRIAILPESQVDVSDRVFAAISGGFEVTGLLRDLEPRLLKSSDPAAVDSQETNPPPSTPQYEPVLKFEVRLNLNFEPRGKVDVHVFYN